MAAKHKLRLLFATILSVSVLSIVPAYAQHGADDTSASSSSTTSTTADDATSTSTSNSGSGSSSSGSSSRHSTETESETNDAADDNGQTSGTDSVRDRAKKLLVTQRAKQKEHTTQQRQTVCTKHKTQIDAKMTGLGMRAQKHLDVFNKIFTKVQAFQAKGQLDAPNYEELVAAATTKQTAATQAVDALKALSSTTIDCTATDPASSLAAAKTAADDAKTALQAYRTAVKDVIKALQSANKTDTSGSN